MGAVTRPARARADPMIRDAARLNPTMAGAVLSQ